jgi:type I restriction enzyme M protein
VLRDDGMSYGDYVEQLTYSLFLKMADDQVRVLSKHSAIADNYGWQSLLKLDGDALEIHYRTILTELGKGSGLIPVIFRVKGAIYVCGDR